MTDYLERACEYLGVDKGDVVKHRAEGADYIVIVDKGIAGTPKYRVPLSQLASLEIAEQDTMPEVAILNMSYRELQELAKELGLPANQKADDLILAIDALDQQRRRAYYEEEE